MRHHVVVAAAPGGQEAAVSLIRRVVDLTNSGPPALVIATTGMRLTAKEAQRCQFLGIEVNPDVPDYGRLTHFVIDPPLIRSVKFMCAVSSALHVVHRSWLSAVLATGNTLLPVAEHAYRETATRQSIQCLYGFSLEVLLTVPLEVRRSHFGSKRFLVHPKAEPSEGPNNDARLVIQAAGGVLIAPSSSCDLSSANGKVSRGGRGAALSNHDDIDVVVLPSGTKGLDAVTGPIGRALRRIFFACFSPLAQPQAAQATSAGAVKPSSSSSASTAVAIAAAAANAKFPLVVTVEDIFRSVLTQQALKSSLTLPSLGSTAAAAAVPITASTAVAAHDDDGNKGRVVVSLVDDSSGESEGREDASAAATCDQRRKATKARAAARSVKSKKSARKAKKA
jgi:hypothetical protein